eukprot:6457649-Amphidinium_carterae.3
MEGAPLQWDNGMRPPSSVVQISSMRNDGRRSHFGQDCQPALWSAPAGLKGRHEKAVVLARFSFVFHGSDASDRQKVDK